MMTRHLLTSRLRFRQMGHVQRTCTGGLSWPVAGVLAFLALIALGGYLDEQAATAQHMADLQAEKDRLDQQAALQRAFDDGRAHGHAEMIASAEAAWAAAGNERGVCAGAKP